MRSLFLWLWVLVTCPSMEGPNPSVKWLLLQSLRFGLGFDIGRWKRSCRRRVNGIPIEIIARDPAKG